MKRPQILTYLQAGMVALCYAALIAAVVIKFSGGRASHVITLGLIGSALGFGSRMVGTFAENSLLKVASVLQSASSDTARPPPPLIAVTIRPVPGKDRRYAITIQNGSPDTLSNGTLDHSLLLHPGKFGLDDTHMPSDIWVQPPIHFEKLAPGAQVTLEVDGYDAAPKYDGPRNTRVTVNAACTRSEAALVESENLTASVHMAW